MRVTIDTNVLISIFLFPSAQMHRLVDVITKRHIIVLPSYVVTELKSVIKRKFPLKDHLVDQFIQVLPFVLAYTPERIDPGKFPRIRDRKDLPILATAILEDVDILITGDADFLAVQVERPKILSPAEFLHRYA